MNKHAVVSSFLSRAIKVSTSTKLFMVKLQQRKKKERWCLIRSLYEFLRSVILDDLTWPELVWLRLCFVFAGLKCSVSSCCATTLLWSTCPCHPISQSAEWAHGEGHILSHISSPFCTLSAPYKFPPPVHWTPWQCSLQEEVMSMISLGLCYRRLAEWKHNCCAYPYSDMEMSWSEQKGPMWNSQYEFLQWSHRPVIVLVPP